MMMDQNDARVSCGSGSDGGGGGVSSSSTRSPRFIYWLAFFLCSLVAVGSCIEATDRVQYSRLGARNQKWAVGCSTFTFVVAFAVAILHLRPIGTIFIVNTKLEGIAMVLLSIFWITLVGVNTDAGNGLAVGHDGAVVYGNLYYSTWVGFVLLCTLAVSYIKSVYSVELSDELVVRSDRMNLWTAASVTFFVVLVSAANVYDHSCPWQDRDTKFCKRSVLAIINGFIGASVSMVVISMKVSTGKVPWILETSFSVIIFLVNSFSVALVTCEQGPGAKIGNLFYFSWAAILLAFMLVSSNYDDFHNAQQRKHDQMATLLAAQKHEDDGIFYQKMSDLIEEEHSLTLQSVFESSENKNLGFGSNTHADSHWANEEHRSRRSQRSGAFGSSYRSAHIDDCETVGGKEYTPPTSSMV